MTATRVLPGPADVTIAAARLAGHVRRTPVLDARVHGVLLKGEHRQRTGSFKLRGAANAVLGGRGPSPAGVVTGSSGNHGLAVAGLCRVLGVPATVVVAAGASEAKVAALRAAGADVVRVDGGVARRDAVARDLAGRGALFVPSSDHELVVAGQGTVAREILDDVPDVRTLWVPTGGGGLLAGTCLAVAHLPRVRVVGVEPAGARRYALSLAAGRPVEVPPPDTVADGLRGQRPGEVPLAVVAARVDDLVAVTDDEIRAAAALLRDAGVDAEPSGAVALAGALAAPPSRGPSVAVVSGGNTATTLARHVLAVRPGPDAGPDLPLTAFPDPRRTP